MISSPQRCILRSLRAASQSERAGCDPSGSSGVHGQGEQRRLQSRLRGRGLQKRKCTCFIAGAFAPRTRPCLTLLQPYSGAALLEQLLNGPVQTAAGEHQKVQRSPADKHLNCLILSYPRARLSSLAAHQLLATALPHTRASLHGDCFAQAVKGCLTGCRPGRFGIQRAVTCWITLRVESFRQRREGECGPGSVLEQASPRCSDPATVGSVSASSTLQ